MYRYMYLYTEPPQETHASRHTILKHTAHHTSTPLTLNIHTHLQYDVHVQYKYIIDTLYALIVHKQPHVPYQRQASLMDKVSDGIDRGSSYTHTPKGPGHSLQLGLTRIPVSRLVG